MPDPHPPTSSAPRNAPHNAPRKDARAITRHLDRLARADAAPWLHQEVARRMAQRLPVIRQVPQVWLDWWGFLGGGGDSVRAVLPDATRLVAEPTPALRARSVAVQGGGWWSQAKARLTGHTSAPQVLALSEVPDGAAQMVWANMMLHAVPEETATLARWHRALASDGYLMFSSLGPDTLRGLREVFAEIGAPPPHPPFVDMHDLGDMLVQAGFADPVMDQETILLHWSSPEAVLAELRSLGGHIGVDRFAGLRTPRWRARLLAALARRRDGDGRIGLGFEIVYGHAFKALPKPDRDGQTVIPLQTLRESLGLSSRRAPGGLRGPKIGSG